MPRTVVRDPLLWIGAFVAAGLHAWMLFGGECLPYVDLPNHLALISVLADGGDTGALQFFERSYAPSIYLLFYLTTAAFAQLVSVPAAAKLSLVVATMAMVFGAAWLAAENDRDPRLGLIAPLAMFGLSFRLGFMTCVFAMPTLLFVLAATERVLRLRREDADRPALVRATAALFVCVAIASIAHGLIYTVTVGLVAMRTLATRSWRSVLHVGLTGLVASLWVLPSLIGSSAIGAEVPEQILGFRSFDERWTWLYWNVTIAGNEDERTIFGVLYLFGAAMLLSVVRPLRAKKLRWAVEAYALVLVLLYFYGPGSFAYPFAMWLVVERIAPFGVLMLFLLPRVNLAGWPGWAFGAVALFLVHGSAQLNRERVVAHAELAARYDPVRKAIPKGATVLPVIVPDRGDWAYGSKTLQSLHFYHMTDGAAFVPYAFDLSFFPVHVKRTGHRAPPPAGQLQFNPHIHGVDYEYVVVRGTSLVKRTDDAGRHERVLEANGWVVYKTKKVRAGFARSHRPDR